MVDAGRASAGRARPAQPLRAGSTGLSVNLMAGDGPCGRLGVLGGELTGFVGRRGELAEVREVLAGARLVTLTGPGGIGKTRLAVRAAAEMRRGFRDGTWVVERAGLRDAASLAAEVARSLGLLDQSSRWGVAALAERLAARQMLLVVDNCEHLRDACAVFAGALLRACPALRILATSRGVLGLVGRWQAPSPTLTSQTLSWGCREASSWRHSVIVTPRQPQLNYLTGNRG
jgi:hypothetical protein